MRIDRLLANAGLGTRKEVHFLIKDGRVFVDSKQIKAYGEHVNPDLSIVEVDGEVINYQPFHYVLLNKPAGYISSTVHEAGNPPVTDLLLEYEAFDLAPVGRLDLDTRGVLLLTNNGKLAHRLLSPKHDVKKTYEAKVNKPLTHDLIKKFNDGININDEYITKPAQLEFIEKDIALVTISEGKYHQVKRMFKACGYEVIELVRTRFAFLTVDDLAVGSSRELTPEETKKLLEY